MIQPGSKLGHYQIIDQVGKGGMGEVYRARDTKLGREVAIKVLPSEFSSDEDRLVRLEREARALAALNHPNIAAIYGLERFDDTRFLVLELVEGGTLADLLERGPIPVERSLKLALQMAEAMEAAHEKGVIHRDLKPANIKVTPEGRLKVLDFGLAKTFVSRDSGLDLSEVPTLAPDVTQPGVLLGTAAYMSPEQARGETADHRADIWAFGCVLYEMLTGSPAFGRSTMTETIARILEAEPDLEQLPADTPPLARRLLQRCLEKAPRDRLQHMGDARIDIRDALEAPGLPQDVGSAGTAVASRRRFVAVVGAGAAGLLAGSWVTSRFGLDSPTVTRLAIGPVPLATAPSGSRYVSISPDGSVVAYTTGSQIWIKRMRDAIPTAITASQFDPFFSPDGEWVAYFGEDKMSRIPVTGGTPVPMFDLGVGTGGGGRPAGGAWRADGMVIVATGAGLFQASAVDQGVPLRLLVDPPEGSVYAWPQFLPDGRSVIFSIVSGSVETSVIAKLDLETLEVEPLVTGGVGAYYLPEGYLVYATPRGLGAVAFDADSGRARGTPVDIPGLRVRVTGVYLAPAFAVSSETGTLVHVPPLAPDSVQLSQLVWVDDQGREEVVAGQPPGAYPRVSPDGSRLALNGSPPGSDLRRIWVFDLERQSNVQVSGLSVNGAFEDLLPQWSADGRRIYFASTRNGPMQVWSVAADGSGTEELMIGEPNTSIWPHPAHPNGLLLVGRGPYGSAIGFVDLANPADLDWVLERPSIDAHPALSPDGNWLAYDSDESGGQPEVYVRPFPNVDAGRVVVSVGGGAQPRWDPRGRNRLYYRNLAGDMMTATFELSPTFRVLGLSELFPNNNYGAVAQSGVTYDISPADGRFIIRQGANGRTPVGAMIQVTLNWREELKTRIAGP